MKRALLLVSFAIVSNTCAVAGDRLIMSADEQYLGTKVNSTAFLTCSGQTVAIGKGRVVHVPQSCDRPIDLTMHVDDVDRKDRQLKLSAVTEPKFKLIIPDSDKYFNAGAKWEKIRSGDDVRLVILAEKLQPSIVDQNTLNQLTAVANNACLANSPYALMANVNGHVSFGKASPGGSGSVNVDVWSGPSAVQHFDEKIKRVADDKVRNCLQPYTNEIFDKILNPSMTVVP
ncbi:hypothetical protein QFZ99_006104 [Paraburkholderia atlantica]|uniref:hypothetical protein n=1 Tax=Paraburkholderia atlantica TaxID=2654982 RepID=UPI003D19C73A